MSFYLTKGPWKAARWTNEEECLFEAFLNNFLNTEGVAVYPHRSLSALKLWFNKKVICWHFVWVSVDSFWSEKIKFWIIVWLVWKFQTILWEGCENTEHLLQLKKSNISLTGRGNTEATWSRSLQGWRFKKGKTLFSAFLQHQTYCTHNQAKLSFDSCLARGFHLIPIQ